MSSKLQRLLDSAEESGINLNNVDIDLHFLKINFWQHREARANFRAVKRWVDGFKKDGTPPYVELKKTVDIAYMKDGENFMDGWTVKWNGAYECKAKGYDCTPASFRGEDVDPADSEIEDWQLVKDEQPT